MHPDGIGGRIPTRDIGDGTADTATANTTTSTVSSRLMRPTLASQASVAALAERRNSDGSGGVGKGKGDGANKWYLHHQGGGWCDSLDDCLDRSKSGAHGSSRRVGGPERHKIATASPMARPLAARWLHRCLTPASKEHEASAPIKASP